MRKLILKTDFSLGDVVMMTAAVRDLHRCYPNIFVTDVRTHFPEIWENNPDVTFLDERDPEVEVVACRYPLINYANQRPYHCLHGYISFLNSKLNLRIQPTEFKGSIYLTREEREWASQVHELAGRDLPFWIVSAGGKYDITIKWWATERYQRVVDHFQGRIAFVQIGDTGHHHPKLRNAVDLRGQTTIRELIRLVYHAQGCLCPVTGLMHLAATVETKVRTVPNRPCVVIAGGREPMSWEAYPHHQFLHTVGALSCCRDGGCWKSRVIPLGDDDERDDPDNLCSDVVRGLPHCMEMITADDAIRAIERYFEGGALSYLSSRDGGAAIKAIRASQRNKFDEDSLSPHNSAAAIATKIRKLPSLSHAFSGRGIVICAGGLKYFPCAWVCVKMLRHVGCKLPIELWYRGPEEMDRRMIDLLMPLGVRAVDAKVVELKHPRRADGGWELKAYAIIHSPFEEVLFLDADNVPVKDPTFLFDEPQYRATGSIFWPDYGSLAADRDIWKICDIPYRKEPEFETGQIVVNKTKCWRALDLAFWFNEHSDFFFDYIHGDKETFHLAWRKVNQAYTMIATPVKSLRGVMCQHDFRGDRLFQHRNSFKWRAFEPNTHIRGFLFERNCLDFLAELEEQWDGKIHFAFETGSAHNEFVFRGSTYDRCIYQNVVEKNEYQLPERFGSKDVIIDIGAHIGSFSYACIKRGARRVLAFEAEAENVKIARRNLQDFKRLVRVFHKAVWRSDRHTTTILHSGYTSDEQSINTGGGTVLVNGEDRADHKRKEIVQTISLDDVLRRFKSVELMKLDCEGSEWPILLTSKLLSRVNQVCGEYHEIADIPTPARVAGYKQYTKKVLEEYLSKHYKSVRIQAHGSGQLGHFWAKR